MPLTPLFSPQKTPLWALIDIIDNTTSSEALTIYFYMLSLMIDSGNYLCLPTQINAVFSIFLLQTKYISGCYLCNKYYLNFYFIAYFYLRAIKSRNNR